MNLKFLFIRSSIEFAFCADQILDYHRKKTPKSFSLEQSDILFRSFIFIIIIAIEYSIFGEEAYCGFYLVGKVRNNNGPNTVPWGTPERTPNSVLYLLRRMKIN